jgi:hypothetical protein
MRNVHWVFLVSAALLAPQAAAKSHAEQTADAKLTGLIVAVRSMPRPAVEPLLNGRTELVTARDAAGSTPLHHAAAFGSLDTMTLLIDAGADVNARNNRGSTPLHWAIHDEAKVRLLLSRGAAVNAKQAEGRTPLYLAASLGNGNAILRLLLDAGANPNLGLTDGRTPLTAATDRRDMNATRMLMEHGAVMGTRTKRDEPPAATALELLGSPERLIDFEMPGPANVAWQLVDLGMNDVPKCAYTDAAVRAIKAMQRPQGNWAATAGSRAASMGGEFQATALAIYAIRHYTPAGHSASSEESVGRAVQWLKRSKPQTSEERAFHALALVWASEESVVSTER